MCKKLFTALLAATFLPSLVYSQAVELVTASSHDGHPPTAVLDGSLEPESRWSAQGDGAWIQFDLGTAGPLEGIDIAFYRGDSRQQYFDIEIADQSGNWQTAYSGASNGRDLDFQRIAIAPQSARLVRIVGHGTNVNNWNSLTEVGFVFAGTDPGNSEVQVTASGDDGHRPENTMDNSLDAESRWSAQGDGHWLQYDLGSVATIASVDIAFYHGDSRLQYFDIDVADDAGTWQRVFTGSSRGDTTQFQTFQFTPVAARLIRITGHGTSSNNWNSVTEVEINLASSNLPPEEPPTTPPPIDVNGIQVSASGDDGHPASNTLDGSFAAESRWSVYGEGQWVKFDLGTQRTLKGVDIGFYQSADRAQRFTIALATVDGNWKTVYTGTSRLNGSQMQHYGFFPHQARYVRIQGFGSDTDDRTALLEVAPVVENEIATPAVVNGSAIYVAPNGNNSNSGSSASSPLRTIQTAVERAQPGDRIILAPGRYFQDVDTVRSGTATQPITIQGPSDAIIQGSGDARIIEITHDHIRLLGFTVDGKINDGNSENDYRDKLVYVQGTQTHRGPRGLVIRSMTFLNAGGECLRLRYFIRNADVGFNHFENCGVHDFQFGTGGKNGEAIYLGTSSTQWGDGKNPTSDADISTYNRIHHNTFITRGNECVDIKEGSVANIVEYNYCSDQRDPNSGGFDSRSDNNIFRYNVSTNNQGAGVRLGGHTVDGHFYGQGNQVYGNTFTDNDAGTIKLQAPNQDLICENTVTGSRGRDIEGSYTAGYDASSSCPL
jgi:hypothetical protein